MNENSTGATKNRQPASELLQSTFRQEEASFEVTHRRKIGRKDLHERLQPNNIRNYIYITKFNICIVHTWAKVVHSLQYLSKQKYFVQIL